jgi:hypothetical protein
MSWQTGACLERVACRQQGIVISRGVGKIKQKTGTVGEAGTLRKLAMTEALPAEQSVVLAAVSK